DDDVPSLRAFGNSGEPEERVSEGFPTGNRHMNIDTAAGFLEDPDHFAFDKIRPEGQKSSCAAIDHENAVGGRKALDQHIIAFTLNQPVGVHKVELFCCKCPV